MLPCGRFGANAAWLRMAAITHNVLTAMKRLALPAELLRARPKRLRFLFLNAPGRLVQHARKLVLKLGLGAERIRQWSDGAASLPVLQMTLQLTEPSSDQLQAAVGLGA